ncbi:unnamed protein product [Heligmosomoides polygyrus]|uniref:HYPK_UBA domain-containing protein n=1 Tax=Heligmosomoides polygyrus TaxID=6339 RepID=A0A183GI87_HELPZ|nr:unnamed protein product [Heligmosomoides polygyrus]
MSDKADQTDLKVRKAVNPMELVQQENLMALEKVELLDLQVVNPMEAIKKADLKDKEDQEEGVKVWFQTMS